MAGHRRGGIIQHDQCQVRLIIECVDHLRDAGGEKCRISHKSEAGSIRLGMVHTLRDADAGSHAQAGVAHIQRRRVAQRVTADIPAVDGLFALHRRLDRIEGCPVRTSRAQHGRAHGKRRRSGQLAGLFGRSIRFPQECVQHLPDDLHGVLT